MRSKSEFYLSLLLQEQLAAGLITVAEARAAGPPTCERTMRQDDLLSVPRSRTEMGRRRFTCQGPVFYNDLPRDLVQLPVPPFGRRLKRHLSHLPPD